jgi:hypothetical protein
MLFADSFSGDAVDPPAAGVVHTLRLIDGGDAYRYAMLKANLSCLHVAHRGRHAAAYVFNASYDRLATTAGGSSTGATGRGGQTAASVGEGERQVQKASSGGLDRESHALAACPAKP